MSRDLVRLFKSYFDDFLKSDAEALGAIYSLDAAFTDPVHAVTGLDAISRYFENSKSGLRLCRFEFDHEALSESSAYFQWRMKFAHRKVAGGRTIEVPGVTYLEFQDKVNTHKDFYDMGALLYEHIPVMGFAARFIKSKISS